MCYRMTDASTFQAARDGGRKIARTFLAFALLVPGEDVLEAVVDDDLLLVLLDAAETRVGLESRKAGVGHDGGRRRRGMRQPIRTRGRRN